MCAYARTYEETSISRRLKLKKVGSRVRTADVGPLF